MSAPSVLFVCLGNICRSPLAEAAFRYAVGQAGLELTIDSAGTGGWHKGKAPDPRAQSVAKRNGCDISHYRARQVCLEDFHRFTHILALDRFNLSDLLALTPPDAAASVTLLLDHVDGMKGRSVADPYYGDAADFATTWREVSTAALSLISRLRSDA